MKNCCSYIILLLLITIIIIVCFKWCGVKCPGGKENFGNKNLKYTAENNKRAVETSGKLGFDGIYRNLFPITSLNKELNIKNINGIDYIKGIMLYRKSKWAAFKESLDHQILSWNKMTDSSIENKDFFDKLLWVSSWDQIKKWAKNYKSRGKITHTRLLQLSGFPYYKECDKKKTCDKYNKAIFMWIPIKDLMRPCLDPETDDYECRVTPYDNIPSFRDYGPIGGKDYNDWKSWILTKRKASSNWVNPSNPETGYPFTGLGYTYDWGSKSKKGLSEYVVLPNTKVIVTKIMDITDYIDLLNSI